jgi:hypothetical protein
MGNGRDPVSREEDQISNVIFVGLNTREMPVNNRYARYIFDMATCFQLSSRACAPLQKRLNRMSRACFASFEKHR